MVNLRIVRVTGGNETTYVSNIHLSTSSGLGSVTGAETAAHTSFKSAAGSARGSESRLGLSVLEPMLESTS